MLTPAYNVTANERVLPRMALNFTTGVLDPRVSITRALNTATRVNSSGLIEIVNADLPRFDYDPVTLAPKGLLVEESRANLLLHSSDLAQANWVKTNATSTLTAVGPTGAVNSASTLTATANNATVLQTITSASAARATTCYVKRRTGTGVVEMTQDNGATWAAITVTSSWTRVTIASATVTNPVVGLRIVTNGDAIDVALFQCETGTFATSAIPTTTTSLTRNADNVTMTGTNFSDWYNPAQGALSAVANSNNIPNTDSIVRLAVVATSNALLTNAVRLERVFGTYRAVTTVAGTSALVTGAWAPNTIGNLVSAYGANAAAAFNGNATQPFAQTAPVGPVVLAIGSNGFGANYFCGHIMSVRYFPQRLINAEVRAFSK